MYTDNNFLYEDNVSNYIAFYVTVYNIKLILLNIIKKLSCNI